MTKKIKIIVSIICVVLLGIGLTVWNEYREYKEGGDIFGADDFTVQTSNDEKIIKNEEIGLSFKIPADWQTGTFVGGDLLLLPSNYKANPNDIFSEKDCLFTVSAFTYGKYEINYALDVQKNIERLLQTDGELEKLGIEQVIIVDGRQACKEVYGVRSKSEDYEAAGRITVKIPRLEKATEYCFETKFLSKNFEKCQKEFDQVLATVKIE